MEKPYATFSGLAQREDSLGPKVPTKRPKLSIPRGLKISVRDYSAEVGNSSGIQNKPECRDAKTLQRFWVPILGTSFTRD
jgi:hypothetical protein